MRLLRRLLNSVTSLIIKSGTRLKQCILLAALCGLVCLVVYHIGGVCVCQQNEPNIASKNIKTEEKPTPRVGLEKGAVARYNLSGGFKWLPHKVYDQIDLTLSTNESIVETALFTYMKQPQISCPNKIRMGRDEDGGWMGGEWSFDEMITTKYGCQDMAYDPSIGKPDHRPNPLLWFFNTGLGDTDEINSLNWRVRKFSSLLKENSHTKTTIDILKMDIEYSEWRSLQTMLDEPSCLDNVKQLMIEFHTREMTPGSQSSIADLLFYWNVAKGLDKLGFKLWTHWDNDFCSFSSKRTPGHKLCGCFNAYYVNTRLL